MRDNTTTLGIIAIIVIGSLYIFYKEHESEARDLELLAKLREAEANTLELQVPSLRDKARSLREYGLDTTQYYRAEKYDQQADDFESKVATLRDEATLFRSRAATLRQ